MLSGAAGAYSGKIPFCAPMSRYRRGLLRQNPYLRPDIPVSTGLITAKSLSTPRYPGIDGAYYGKILIYAPISRYRRGLFQQNSFLRPDILPATGLITAKSLSTPRYPASDGAYYGKILIYAPISCQRRGLLRQNPYLCPDVPVSTGLITAKSLSVPRCTKVEGIIDLILSHIPAFASSAGYR